MSNELKDYGQLFCEAVDTIVKERLSGIKFDSTILCTIVDDKDKAQGKYVVSYSDAKFEAYSLSETKYNINNNVYVQIPQGDWNEQKFIVGKKTNNEDTPVNYQYPFDSYVDITGNIINNTPKVKGNLIANGNGDYDESGNAIPGADEIVIWSYNLFESKEDIEARGGTETDELGEEFSKYTRLGIQAQFRSWVNDLDAVRGSYGLRLRIEAENQDQSEIDRKEEQEESTENENQTQDSPATEETPKVEEIVYYDFLLDSSDMVGNPYAFDSYFQQEKLFNIADIYRIKKMQLQFYQKGDFKTSNGEAVETLNSPNLFVKDVYISLGYDANEFENDTAVIYTLDSPKYDTLADPEESNHRIIQVRWIHRFDDIIKSVNKKDDIDYTITWYKYRLGAYSHTPQSGADWVPLSEQEVKDFNFTYNIIDQEWLDYNLTAEAGRYREPGFNFTWLIPDITLAQETLKAIISYNIGDQQVYVISDPLIFTNRQEVVSKPTVDAVSALSIVCEDESFGNYRIYNQGNELLNPSEGAKERTFKAYFKGGELTNAESIEWIIPTNNTMLVLENGYYSPDRYWEEGRTHIKRYGDKSKKWDIKQSNSQKYKIRRYYTQQYANNTIQCKVIKDKITYTATKELTFGPAGSNGSDHTLIIDFDDGFTAVPYLAEEFLTNGKPNEKVKTALIKPSYGLTARLYNFENQEIIFDTVSGYTLTWSFYLQPEKDSALKLIEGYKEERVLDDLGRETYDENGKLITKKTNVNYKKRLEIDYSKINMNSLYIVKVELKWRNNPNDETESDTEVLTAYLSIPIYRYLNEIEKVEIKDEKDKVVDTKELILQPSFIGGATQVIYMSNGYPNYHKGAYQIFYNEYNELEDSTLVVETTKEWKENIEWYLCGNLDEYSPKHDKNNSLVEEKNRLCPVGIYVKEANPYGIQCRREGQPIWTQPIFVTINRYPNSMVNEWDGKTLTMDEESGAILSTAIATGKKEFWVDDKGETHNAFTGVMLGDWYGATNGDIEESLTRTGVYGFHRGEVSYAFMEDGTSFIGKPGHGRIHLDGDNGTIYSAGWDENLGGMKLDIDEGHLAMYRSQGLEETRLSKSNFNNLSAEDKKNYYVYREYQIVLKANNNLMGQQLYTPSTYSKASVSSSNYINNKYYFKDSSSNSTITNLLTVGQYNHLTGLPIIDTGEENITTLIDPNYFSLSDITTNIYANKKFSIFCYDSNKNFIGQLKQQGSSYILGKIANDLKEGETEVLYKFEASKKITKSILSGISRKITSKDANDQDVTTEYKLAYVRISLDNEAMIDIELDKDKIFIFLNDNKKSALALNEIYSFQTTKPSTSSVYNNLYLPETFIEKDIYSNNFNFSTGLYYKKYGDYNEGKYISLEELEKYMPSLVYDPKETYYVVGPSYYIDLGVDEPTIPLSIGTEKTKKKRKFYVEWDGTLHAVNGEFSGKISATEIEGGYINGAIIDGGTINGTTINGTTINGSDIFFGNGDFYLYKGSNGTELKTANDMGSSFEANGITYTKSSQVSAEKAGYLGYSMGAYNLGGNIVRSGVLVLDSSTGSNENIESADQALPIIIRSDDRVLIYSIDSWVMLQTNKAKVKVNIPTGYVSIEAEKFQFEGEAAKPENQENIYARFA